MGGGAIVPITMPKWGLSMTEGKVVAWLVEEGRAIKVGDELMDIETEKIANTFEALDSGVLRRKVAAPDQVLPIGALLGVLAPAEIGDEAVDAYVAEFLANYVPPATDDADTGPAYQWAETGAGKLRYSRLGEAGPNVILIHGFGGDLDNWLFNQEPLAAQAQVYALDLPGHGQSTKQLADGSLAGLAESVAGFMDALGIAEAHLVGHSLGGALALRLAAIRPERVLSLSLLAPAGVGAAINGGYIQGFIQSESRRDLKPILQELVADPKLINRQLIDDILKYKRLDGVSAALSRIAAGFVAGDAQLGLLRAQLGGLAMPVQICWGTADRIIPANQATGLPDNVRVHLVDGAGHLVQMEAASQVNGWLKAMWERS